MNFFNFLLEGSMNFSKPRNGNFRRTKEYPKPKIHRKTENPLQKKHISNKRSTEKIAK